MYRFVVPIFAVLASCLVPFAVAADEHRLDLAALPIDPAAFTDTTFASDKATLASDKWAFLRTKNDHADAELAATVTLLEPARQLRFFGESWSVWPDPNYGDERADG